MPDQVVKRSAKIGLPPGSPVYVGKKKAEPVKITVIDYDEKNYHTKTVENIEETFPYRERQTVTWINIDGLHETPIVEKVGQHFDIHPLVVEDILSTHQRPKVEVFEHYIVVIFKMIQYEASDEEIAQEQVSLVMGKNFVITFQEEAQRDVFDPLRNHIETAKGRIRKSGADYLAYAIMDIIVDHYFLVLERLGEEIEHLEDAVLENHNPSLVSRIHHLKRQLLELRKAIWPLREVISNLQRSESLLIKKTTIHFIRDLYDHTIQVIDTLENYRERVSSVLDIYLTQMSNRLNEVMKVLTIISTIFIPLSFLAGVYGMNFDTGASPLNMPELKSPYGYVVFWFVALAVGGGLLLLFKKKRWM